jgi:hypothetical protein
LSIRKKAPRHIIVPNRRDTFVIGPKFFIISNSNLS